MIIEPALKTIKDKELRARLKKIDRYCEKAWSLLEKAESHGKEARWRVEYLASGRNDTGAIVEDLERLDERVVVAKQHLHRLIDHWTNMHWHIYVKIELESNAKYIPYQFEGYSVYR